MNNLLGKIIIILITQLLHYIRYLLVVPLLVFYIFFVFAIIILIKESIFGGSFGFLFGFLNNIHAWRDFTISTKDILMIYIELSLFLYFAEIITTHLLKIKINISATTRLKTILFSSIFLVFFFIIIILPSVIGDPTNEHFLDDAPWVFIIVFAPIPLTILAFFVETINAIIKTLQEFVSGRKNFPVIHNIQKRKRVE